MLTIEIRRYSSGYINLKDFILTDHICDYVGHQVTYKEAVSETCTEPGNNPHYFCPVCEKCFADKNAGQEIEDPDTLIIPAHHNWGEWEESKAATCSADGEEQRICTSDPSHTESREIPASGHIWGDWETEVPATCTEAGTEIRVCSKDASHVESREIPATGHDWDEWTVTRAATTSKEGEETRICKNDSSHIERRIIEKLPPESVVSEPDAAAAKGGKTAGTVAYGQASTGRQVENGQSVTQPEGVFTITSASTGTVAFTASANKKRVTVPDEISVSGRQFAVTEVSPGAFAGSRIRTVTIGKNVRKIRKNAFKKSKVTKLVIKSKNLTKASVKGSLKGSKIKTIQIKTGSKKDNKKYVKKYKSFFTKKNAGKKVTVK